jgi:peptidyl-prolyl cis-trans isomerase C
MKGFPMKKLLASAAIVALTALPLAAQETEVDASTVLATVNGSDITVGHLVAMRAMLPEQYQQLPPQILFDGMLEQLVQQQVLADVAAEELTNAMELAWRTSAAPSLLQAMSRASPLPRSRMRTFRPNTMRNTPLPTRWRNSTPATSSWKPRRRRRP